MNGDRLKPGERLMGWVLNTRTRLGATGLAVVVLGWALIAHGYPWWLWVPACFLAGVLLEMLSYIVAYMYQKKTYPQRAGKRKQWRNQGRGEG